ncbi:MAG: hypothetical protein FD154_1611 [Elusimicrobia bacterium]|nr:MAG: hypothetical protein FD154_1611 [Elusimicrobiota bacterium]
MISAGAISSAYNTTKGVPLYGYYDRHEVQRGDIVVCRFSFSRDPLRKIARAVPGDRFALEERPDFFSGP